jgi:pimeloyl-ACP methyl ester carboxylesterase
MNSEDLTLSSDGLNLAARIHWPQREDPAPALILCHGFGSCKENHAAFAAGAAGRGWAVLSFDFRGHGASDGCVDSRTINDVGAALAWLQRHPGVDRARIAVRGSSMGGYFAIHAARQWPEGAACVAVSTPDEAALSDLLRAAKNPSTFYGQWRLHGSDFPRVMNCDLSCWLDGANCYSAVAGIAPRPVLLIACTGDEVVPPEISARLYAAAGEPKTFWLLEGGDHRSAAHDPAVSEQTLAWLETAL